MAHRGALRAAHQFHEQFAFLGDAVGIGQLARCLDRFDGGVGGIKPADAAGLRCAEAVEEVGIAHAVLIGLALG